MVPYAVDMAWERPSDRVSELLRQSAELTLAKSSVLDLTELFAGIDTAILVDLEPALRDDPALRETIRRSNRSIVMAYLNGIVADPGGRVPVDRGPAAVASVRDLVRRGFADAVLQGFRAGQNVAWQLWMQGALDLTTDRDELRELLSFSARSLFTFIDDSISATAELIRQERHELTSGTHAQRLETVMLLLEGTSISTRVASSRLGYDLRATHVAAILWSDETTDDARALERAASVLANHLGSARVLTILAATHARWMWVSTSAAADTFALERELAPSPVRLAIGAAAVGVDGFRSSHHQALAMQRLMMRANRSETVARWQDVQLAVLISSDATRAREFVRDALGELAHSTGELRETVRVYLREQSNAARAAQRLHTHRNTVLQRVAKADKLLPAPLSETNLEVALALEVQKWTD